MGDVFLEHCQSLLSDLRKCLRGGECVDLPVYCRRMKGEEETGQHNLGRMIRIMTPSLLVGSVCPLLLADSSIDCILLPDTWEEHFRILLHRLLTWNRPISGVEQRILEEELNLLAGYQVPQHSKQQQLPHKQPQNSQLSDDQLPKSQMSDQQLKNNQLTQQIQELQQQQQLQNSELREQLRNLQQQLQITKLSTLNHQQQQSVQLSSFQQLQSSRLLTVEQQLVGEQQTPVFELYARLEEPSCLQQLKQKQLEVGEGLILTAHPSHTRRGETAAAILEQQQEEQEEVVGEGVLRRGRMYGCERCHKQFSNRRALRHHVNSHLGIKPYECATCGKAFTQRTHLNVHQRVHTGERGYVCYKCGKSFSVASNMRKHLALHGRDADDVDGVQSSSTLVETDSSALETEAGGSNAPIEAATVAIGAESICSNLPDGAAGPQFQVEWEVAGPLTEGEMQQFESNRTSSFQLNRSIVLQQDSTVILQSNNRREENNKNSTNRKGLFIENNGELLEENNTRLTLENNNSLLAQQNKSRSRGVISVRKNKVLLQMNNSVVVVGNNRKKEPEKVQTGKERLINTDTVQGEGWQERAQEQEQEHGERGQEQEQRESWQERGQEQEQGESWQERGQEQEQGESWQEKRHCWEEEQVEEWQGEIQPQPQENSMVAPGYKVAEPGDKVVVRGGGGPTCQQCGKQFKSNSKLNSHMVTHTGARPYPCTLCSKRFTQQSHLNKHTNTVHRRQEEEGTGGRQFTCQECGKVLSARSSLEKHMMLHTNRKPFQCQLCTKAFVQKSHLTVHMLRHSGSRPHQCVECGKGFTSRGHLKTHSLLHTGEKRVYQCVECNAQYFGLADLEVHLLKHSGEFPFPCDQCEKRFRSGRIRDNHRRTHTGEKPYKCRKCRKAFTATSGLNQHLKRNQECRSYSCQVPGSFSARGGDMLQQVEKSTSGAPDTVGNKEASLASRTLDQAENTFVSGGGRRTLEQQVGGFPTHQENKANSFVIMNSVDLSLEASEMGQEIPLSGGVYLLSESPPPPPPVLRRDHLGNKGKDH